MCIRILGLDERKGRWVEEQDFHGNFLVNVTLFFTFSTLCVTELSLFWYGLKDLFTLHKSARSKLSLTIKTEDVTSGRRDADLHRRPRAAQGRIG